MEKFIRSFHSEKYQKIKIFLKRLFPPIILEMLSYLQYRINKCQYDRIIKKRKSMSIFDVENISMDFDLVTREYGYNAFYGLNYVVNKALGTTGIVDGHIEHGVSYTGEIDGPSQKADIIITMSEERKEFLSSVLSGKKIIAIGPYIKYVNGIMSDSELKKYKKTLGKVLVVFPSHSTSHIIEQFNEKRFIQEIENIRNIHQFNTVLVCIYWKDYLVTHAKIYKEQGYKICCAGHIFDPLFLRRLKSIIELSDITMGNSFGTNIGYSVCLSRPFYLFCVKSKTVKFDGVGEYTTSPIALKRYEDLLKEAEDIFGQYKEYISNRDIEFVKKYWGK